MTVPVQILLFFFGLVNAGVPLANLGPGTWYVTLGLVLGKPSEILFFTLAAQMCGGGKPRGVTYRDIFVQSVAAAIGFTVALFFATAAFSEGRALDETKMGAPCSVVAAPLAYLIARLMPPNAADHPQ